MVHATTGLLPRKSLARERGWLAGLAAIRPTLRVGPILTDPSTVRAPLANDLHGSWTFSHRTTPDTWEEDPVIKAAPDPRLSDRPVVGLEGWLRYTPAPQE